MDKKLRLFAFLWIFISSTALFAQTSANLRYIYDEAGQLVGVIDENNNAAAYHYDVVGNLLSIERLTARGAVDLFFVEPNRGQAATPSRPGTSVTIHGVGFSSVPAQNQVSFNGVAAVVDASTTTMIKTTVPARAMTGPVQVTAPLGMGVSRRDFIVVPAVTVAVNPGTISLGVGQTQQFTATLMRGDTVIGGGVYWRVNGRPGGDRRWGTISTGGLYTAPASLPFPPRVTVTATSVDDPTTSGNATVNLIARLAPIYAQEPSYRIGGPEQFPIGPIYAQEPSYRIGGPEQFPIGPIYAQEPSYRIGGPAQFPIGPIYAREPSYRIGRLGQFPISPIYTQEASYTTIVITGLNPDRLARGAVSIPFTVTGRDFNAATALDFLLPGGVRDSNISLASLTLNPDGTEITGRISVAATAALGARIVVVRTAIGSSATTATASNQLMVQ